MEISDGIILGLIQGITEFLPISSTGHLVLVREVMDISSLNMLAVDAVLHLATTAAIIIYFWTDLWVLLQALLRKLGRLPVYEKDLLLVYALLVGTVPAVAFGLLLESHMERFQTPIIVGTFLGIAALFFLFVEWRYLKRPEHGSVTLKRAWQVGLFQALALIPGLSRSGTTIAGGMLLGMSRYEASRFSFLLAIPITLAVGSKKTIELLSTDSAVEWIPLMVAAGVSFFSALIVIHYFLKFIRKYTLWPFVWYSLLLASFIWYVSFFAV